MILIFKPAELKGMSHTHATRSSAIAEGPRDASCQLKFCQLPRNSAETTYTTSPDQIDGMKLEIYNNNNNNDRLTAFDPGQPG